MVRTILLTVNWLPFVLYLVLLARLAERFGTTDWGRLFVLAAGCFATLLTPFPITLNNHTVATCSALFALYPALRSEPSGKRSPAARGERRIGPACFVAGRASSPASRSCNELPAAAFAGGLGVLLLLAGRRCGRWLFFVPAAALPVAALLLTNYLAIGQLRPAYSEFGGRGTSTRAATGRADRPTVKPRHRLGLAEGEQGRRTPSTCCSAITACSR